eukprot:1410628-Rhodomonas_salina.2
MKSGFIIIVSEPVLIFAIYHTSRTVNNHWPGSTPGYVEAAAIIGGGEGYTQFSGHSNCRLEVTEPLSVSWGMGTFDSMQFRGIYERTQGSLGARPTTTSTSSSTRARGRA